MHSQAKIAVAIVGSMLAMMIPPGTHAVTATSGTLPGSGYVAVRFSYAGSHAVDLGLKTQGCRSGCVAGFEFVMPNGSYWGGEGFASWQYGNDDCLVVRTSAATSVDACHPSTLQADVERFVLEPLWGSAGLAEVGEVNGSSGDPVGVYTVLEWMAFEPDEQARVSWSFDFTPGEVSVLNVTTGDRAFYASARDFQGPTNVDASFGGAYAQAGIGPRLGVSVQNVLLGFMGSNPTGESTPMTGLTFRGPQGAEACSCGFGELSGEGAVGPGDYELDMSRVSAGHQIVNDLMIGYVDPQLPT